MNVEKIELLISKLEEIGTGGAAMASVTWSYAMSLVNHMARMERIHNEDDPEFSRLSNEQRIDRQTQMEKRAEVIQDIIAWAASNANPDFVPDGDDVVNLALSGDVTAANVDPDRVAQLAQIMDIDEANASTIINASEAHLAEVRVINRRMAEMKRSQFASAINRAITGYVHDDFDLDLRDAARIAERIAEKSEQYEQKRLERAAFTRRARRLAQLGAERRLLAEVMDEADELAAEWQSELERQTTNQEVYDLAA